MAEPVKKSWAQRGKEAVAATVAAKIEIPAGFKKTSGNSTGTSDRAVHTYRFGPPMRRPLGEDESVLNPGDTLIGTFVGTFQDRYKKTYFKFLQETGPKADLNGKIVSISECTSLAMRMGDIPLNKRTFFGYIGLGVAKPGKNAPHLVEAVPAEDA